MRAGSTLSIALKARARVHWGTNGWKNVGDIETRETGLGVHVADLPVTGLTAGASVQFTFCWLDTESWDGRDYDLQVVD